MLWSQSSTSTSTSCYVGTVLLSIVGFLTVDVTVESVLVWATNTHLTLTHLLRILVKRFISIPCSFLRHSLLLAWQIHCFLLLCLARLSIGFSKSGLLIGNAVLEKYTLFVWNCCILNSGVFLVVAERRACILSCTTWTHSIIIFSI